MIFKTCFFTILKKVFKLILGKDFKNSKIYFETVFLPLLRVFKNFKQHRRERNDCRGNRVPHCEGHNNEDLP